MQLRLISVEGEKRIKDLGITQTPFVGYYSIFTTDSFAYGLISIW